MLFWQELILLSASNLFYLKCKFKKIFIFLLQKTVLWIINHLADSLDYVSITNSVLLKYFSYLNFITMTLIGKENWKLFPFQMISLLFTLRNQWATSFSPFWTEILLSFRRPLRICITSVGDLKNLWLQGKKMVFLIST